jgi:hypothetical protein
MESQRCHPPQKRASLAISDAAVHWVPVFAGNDNGEFDERSVVPFHENRLGSLLCLPSTPHGQILDNLFGIDFWMSSYVTTHDHPWGVFVIAKQ